MEVDRAKIVEAFNGASGINGNLIGMMAVAILFLICVFWLCSALLSITDAYRNRREGGINFFVLLWPLVGLALVVIFFSYLAM